MENRSPSIDTENIASVQGSIDRRPWGIYVPPYTEKNSEDAQTNGGGYVRVIDARGKSFPCGFSRPVRSILTVTPNDVVAGEKRSRHQILDSSRSTDSNGKEYEDEGLQTIPTQTNAHKVTITEERIHPEEALFLHMRGLLRIESSSHHNIACSDASKIPETKILSTQELLCIMLPECKIPLAAYLAYAHLRSQGYILIRYTNQRMKLLCKMQQQSLSTKSEKKTSQNIDPLSDRIPIMINELQQDTKLPDNDGNCIPLKSSRERYRTRPLRMLLSDDVATAPPPCVVFYPNDGEFRIEKTTINLHLAFYAYNPNAHFKRSNPGLPDFGVAVMPFRIGPTFDIINSLVSLVEQGEGEERSWNSPKSGIPNPNYHVPNFRHSTSSIIMCFTTARVLTRSCLTGS